MRQSIHSGVLVALATFVSASPAAAPQAPRPCDNSNRALLLSSKHQSEADFWLRVAECLSDPQVNTLIGIKEAYVEWRQADALAMQVFEARKTACELFGHAPHDPRIEPGEFSTTINNTYLPLMPGRVLIREKHTAEGLERIETSVAVETVNIGGVQCRVVREYETLDGQLVEDTQNWVAQHQDRTVWYFGELAMEFEDEVLHDLSGSWRFGSEGALPGILMPGTPQLGATYRQEFLLGRAEDVAQIVALDETVVVPAGVFHHCLVIAEWDPLEPFEYFLTFIAPHVGLVLEIDTRTGERSELVEIHG